MKQPALGRLKKAAPFLAVLGLLSVAAGVREMQGSDHQQTAFTELNPRLDITDVWAFPGSTDGRIVVAMTVASPIVGAQGAFFDPNALYELKVDNNQDGVPDVVMQFLFDDMSDGTQRVSMIGPVAANSQVDSIPGPISGMLPGGISNRIIGASPVITRQALNTNLSANLPAGGGATAGEVQLFAGLRDDPFYIDLEQFFRIIPDRRPVEGPLAGITKSANAFRPDCGPDNELNPEEVGPFDPDHGCAVDFLRGFNALAIVVELPESQLTRGQGNGQLGIYATISR